MPEFQYVAREMSGAEVTGTITATSEAEVVSSLTGQSLFPLRVDETDIETAGSGPFRIRRRVRGRHLATFFSQLADLLRAGVPMLRSLDILKAQSTHPGLALVLSDVRARVADGTPLADAMRAHPKVFSDLSSSMVRAGEEGGFMEEVLKRIAIFTEHQEELKARVMGAMAYPAFLSVVGGIIVTLMLIFFVPKFEPMFGNLEQHGELPIPTRILLAVSESMTSYGVFLFLAVGAAVWALSRYAGTEEGRWRIDYLRLNVKGMGPIVRGLAVSRFCRILGTLLQNGVPILQSLNIAKDAAGNVLLRDAIADAAGNIIAGKSLARPLAASGQFPTEVVEMIAVGEEANNLEEVLVNVADNIERRTNRQLELFVRLLEPMMLLVMASVILFVVVALLLPVFQSTSAFG